MQLYMIATLMCLFSLCPTSDACLSVLSLFDFFSNKIENILGLQSTRNENFQIKGDRIFSFN